MSYFKDDELPSCSECDYATEYIPYYTYPFTDPFCSKGHGKCEVDKLCGDFKPITATCVRCEFIQFDKKHQRFICIKYNSFIPVNSKTCDDFIWRNGELKDKK